MLDLTMIGNFILVIIEFLYSVLTWLKRNTITINQVSYPDSVFVRT